MSAREATTADYIAIEQVRLRMAEHELLIAFEDIELTRLEIEIGDSTEKEQKANHKWFATRTQRVLEIKRDIARMKAMLGENAA